MHNVQQYNFFLFYNIPVKLNYSKIIFTEIFTDKEMKIYIQGEILAIEVHDCSVKQNL